MTLFVYKFLRQAKLFCIYCIMKTFEYRNRAFWLQISGRINRSHAIQVPPQSSNFVIRIHIALCLFECWLVIQGCKVAKQVAFFFYLNWGLESYVKKTCKHVICTYHKFVSLEITLIKFNHIRVDLSRWYGN